MQKLLDKQKKLEELAAKKQEQIQQKQQKENSRNQDINTPSKLPKMDTTVSMNTNPNRNSFKIFIDSNLFL